MTVFVVSVFFVHLVFVRFCFYWYTSRLLFSVSFSAFNCLHSGSGPSILKLLMNFISCFTNFSNKNLKLFNEMIMTLPSAYANFSLSKPYSLIWPCFKAFRSFPKTSIFTWKFFIKRTLLSLIVNCREYIFLHPFVFLLPFCVFVCVCLFVLLQFLLILQTSRLLGA